MPGNVTVGVDGSPESLAALDWAAAEAVLREVPLRIVHIQDWPIPPAYIEHVETWPSSSAVPESSERFRRYEELLQRAAATAQQSHPGLTVTAENLAACRARLVSPPGRGRDAGKCRPARAGVEGP